MEARKELEPLIKNREKIVAELKRLQREHDKLVGFKFRFFLNPC